MSSTSYQNDSQHNQHNNNVSLYSPTPLMKPSQSMQSINSNYTSTSDIVTSNTLQAFSNGFKSIVGSGICALPFAFYASGYIVGLIALCCVCGSSAASMQQLIRCVRTLRKQQRHEMLKNNVINDDNEYTNDRSLSFDVNDLDERLTEENIGFRQLGHICLPGKLGHFIVNVSLLSCQLGGNCAFLSFVVSSIYSILTIHGYDKYISHTMIVLLLFPILSGLALSKSTAYLAPFSHFGNISLFISVMTVVVYSAFHTRYGISMQGLSHMEPYTDWTGLAIFLGVSAFSVCAHAEMMAVEVDAADRRNFHRVITGVMSLITISYAIFGIVIYSAMGKHTSGNILTNLHSTGFVDIVKISMSISVLVMYPMSLIPAVNAIEEMLHMKPYLQSSMQASPLLTRNNSKKYDDDSQIALSQHNGVKLIHIEPNIRDEYSDELYTTGSTDYYKSIILRIAIVVMTCLVTITFNNYGLLVSLVGSIAGGSLSFVLPPYFYWVVHKHKVSTVYKILLTVQILFGFALIGSGLFVAFTV